MATKFAFERREGEGERAFAAFTCYLSLGYDRSIAEVAKRLGKSEVLIQRWSSMHDWASRVAAYSDHMALVDREMAEVAVRAKSPIWAQRQEEMRETAWAVQADMVAVARKALTAFLAKKKAYASMAEVSRLLEVATKLGCMASGLPMERVAVTGGDGGPVKVEFLAALDRAYGDKPAGEVVDVEIAPAAPAALPPGASECAKPVPGASGAPGAT